MAANGVAFAHSCVFLSAYPPRRRAQRVAPNEIYFRHVVN